MTEKQSPLLPARTETIRKMVEESDETHYFSVSGLASRYAHGRKHITVTLEIDNNFCDAKLYRT